MNQIMRDQYPTFREYQSLRDQLLEVLKPSDLAYTPGGANPRLGALCREIGETQRIYTNSFKTWTMDWSYRANDAELETSIARLTAWYHELDQELETTIASLSDDDLNSKLIDRGPNFKLPPHIHLEVYKEALLLFYGKASVYLKALEKPLSTQWQGWVG